MRYVRTRRTLPTHCFLPGFATAERNTAAGVDNDNPPKTFPLMFFTALNLDWYILCVVIWRAFLPMMATLRFAIPIAFAMSFASFFLDVSSVDQLQTTFSFLPYFLLGFRYKGAMEARLKELRSNPLARLAFPIFASVCVISAFFTPMVQKSLWVMCLYGGFVRDMGTYGDQEALMNMTALPHLHVFPDRNCMTSVGVAESLTYYVISMLGVTSLLLSLPDRPVPLLTKAGESAIYIYLTHNFFVGTLAVSTSSLELSDEQAIAISVGGCVCTWAFLATGWITYVCSPCVEPPVDCCTDGDSSGA